MSMAIASTRSTDGPWNVSKPILSYWPGTSHVGRSKIAVKVVSSNILNPVSQTSSNVILSSFSSSMLQSSHYAAHAGTSTVSPFISTSKPPNSSKNDGSHLVPVASTLHKSP